MNGNQQRAAEVLGFRELEDAKRYARDDLGRITVALDAAEARGRAERDKEWRDERDRLRDVLRTHHPIMRSETGPFSGCRCGQVGLGQDVIAHVVAELRAVATPAGQDEEAGR